MKTFLTVIIIFKSICLPADIIQAQSRSVIVSQSESSSTSRAQAWRTDLQYLATELPKQHKNLFFKIKRENFIREVAKLNQAIPGMKDSEIEIALMRLVATVGDSHTVVRTRSEGFSSFPIRFYPYAEGLSATAAAAEYEQVIGTRLIQISRIDAGQASKALRPLVSCENESCFQNALPDLISVPEFLHAQGVIQNPEQTDMVFEKENGDRFTLKVNAVPPAGRARIQWKYLSLPKSPKEQTLWLRNQNLNYWYEYSEQLKLLYFVYNRCRNDDSNSFKEFGEKLLAFADSHPVERFVIDVRRNGGGSEALLLPFIAAIRHRTNINRKGHLFVIIGRGTFSSAAQNAITLKQRTEALLVGEPTGQKPNAYGEVKTFTLPNSGLEVSYSTEFWKRVDGDPPALAPDILIEPSFTEMSAGRDPVLKAILNYKSD